MDLEKYFDTANQSELVQIPSNTIKDGRVISSIHRFFRAGIMENGVFEESPEGVPQGGTPSPLCGNIMLNECDRGLRTGGLGSSVTRKTCSSFAEVKERLNAPWKRSPRKETIS